MTITIIAPPGEVGRGLSDPAWLAAFEVQRAQGRYPGLVGPVRFLDEAFGKSAEFPPTQVKSQAANLSTAIPTPRSTTLARVAKRFEVPPPGTVTPTTPLRLKVAAALAFPDGSMSEKALREMGHARKLTVEKIRGKDYTTLADIEEMRSLCRVQARVQDSARSSEKIGKRCGSSATDSGISAQDALSAKVKKASEASHQPKKSCQNTSQSSTIPKETGEVISLKKK